MFDLRNSIYARPTKAHCRPRNDRAFKHDPARGKARANEPKPTGDIGNAPAYLSDDEQKIWREYRKLAFWLTDCDRLPLEALCRLTAKMRRGEFKATDFGQLRVYIGILGLSPADRSKVHVAVKGEKKQDKLVSLLRGDIAV